MIGRSGFAGQFFLISAVEIQTQNHFIIYLHSREKGTLNAMEIQVARYGGSAEELSEKRSRQAPVL